MSQPQKMPPKPHEFKLKERISTSALAFRGYNVTNLGKTPELLAHPVYAPILEDVLRRTSELCSEHLNRHVDLAERVRSRAPSTLDTFAIDASLIAAVEIAHLAILEQIFDVQVRNARLSLGYSVGELPAVAMGGVFDIEQLLPILLALAEDCADLAKDVTIGIVFTRGRKGIELDDIQRLCLKISSQGKGMIAPSTQLSPNAMLVLGEGTTIDRFKESVPDFFTERVSVKKNANKWPPIHTPLVWRRNVPNRTAIRLSELTGGFQAPSPPVISCVTGKASYNDYNARDLMNQWVDHPQLLWDALYELISSGVQTVIHIGPEPNLIPDTFERLATDIRASLGTSFFSRLGHRVMLSPVIRPWLTPLLSSNAALLRVPFMEHVILEDWFLAQEIH